ncbi:MAG TPA: class I SAM-dependent methyltransferase [Tepidisphaeraceae bacterium]|jgi:SAM-dependent methyltransferase
MQSCVSEEPANDALAAAAGHYWRQSAVRPWVADMSHWRGRWSDDAAWSGIGAAHVTMFRQLCALAARQTPVTSMLEWGPGGGANALAFAPLVKRMYGIDISPPNLGECGRQLASNGFNDWNPIEIDANVPEDALQKLDSPVDFLLCTAVIQHFPSQDYGRRVLKIFNRALANEGLALIQTRYDDGSEVLRCKTNDYEKNVVTFTSYRIDAFWHDLIQAGFEPLSIILRPESCYAYYLTKKGAGRE